MAYLTLSTSQMESSRATLLSNTIVFIRTSYVGNCCYNWLKYQYTFKSVKYPMFMCWNFGTQHENILTFSNDYIFLEKDTDSFISHSQSHGCWWCNEPWITLQWRHDGRDCVSYHQPHDCLHNRLFRRRSKKKSKLRVTGLCAGNSPATGEFPVQMTSSTENISIWWR